MTLVGLAARNVLRNRFRTVLTVLATDPAAEVDVPAWTRMRGHAVLRSDRRADGVLAITVRLGGS